MIPLWEPWQIATDAVERFGLIQARLLPVDQVEADPAMNAPSWWQHEGRRVSAVLLPSEAATDEWWLRWSFVGLAEEAGKAGAELLQAAKQADLIVRGSPWVRETPADGHAHGQIALVAVAAPPR